MTSALKAWSCSKSPKLAEAKRQLDAMPAASTGRGVEVPFPYADRSGYKNDPARSNTEMKELIDNAPVKKVPLEGLHAIQHSVQPRQVLSYVREPDMVPPGARDQFHGGPIDLPIIVHKKGTRYIYDGHHRITAAKLTGRSTVEARYVDLDDVERI